MWRQRWDTLTEWRGNIRCVSLWFQSHEEETENISFIIKRCTPGVPTKCAIPLNKSGLDINTINIKTSFSKWHKENFKLRNDFQTWRSIQLSLAGKITGYCIKWYPTLTLPLLGGCDLSSRRPLKDILAFITFLPKEGFCCRGTLPKDKR